MADRPIIFSAPMVEALLAGTKTQTRRLLAIRGHRSFREFGPSDTKGYDWHFRDAEARWHDLHHVELLKRLRWQAGDRLWGREAFSFDGPNGYTTEVFYRADGYEYGREGGWKSPIHMPRHVSRLTLTVTEVRVQRLQEISEADAKAEGVDWEVVCCDETDPCCHEMIARSPTEVYGRLWNTLHGPAAWDANPWVVALSFTVARGNIDNG